MTTAELVPADQDLVESDEVAAPAPANQVVSPPVAPLGAAAGDPATEPLQNRENDQRVAQLETQLATLEARLTEIDGAVGATGTQLDAATVDTGQLAVRLAAVEAADAEAASKLAAIEAQQSLTGARLDAGDSFTTATTISLTTATERLAGLETRLDALDSQVGGLLDRAVQHDQALGDVHRAIAAEVERYTSDTLVQSQQSLQLAVNSIAQLALAMAESSRDLTEDVSAESATVLLDSFRVDLDAILAQLGFEPLQTAVGEAFDPHRHRALKRVATSDPQQDKAITRVIRDGYRNTATGRILLFADVEVSRHRV